MKTALLIMMLAATRPPAMDPNTLPLPIDPNAYTADLLDYVITDPNVTVVSTVYAHNKRGWLTDLSIIMADGSPTNSMIQRLTEKPVKDPNGGFDQEFQWAWTPPGEGIYYLELRVNTRGKPSWTGDARTIVVYAFADDPPFLWARDIPILRMTQAQRLWQAGQKNGYAMTSPTKVWR